MATKFRFESRTVPTSLVHRSCPDRGQRRKRRSTRLDVCALEHRLLLSGILVTGSGPGAPPEVRVYSAQTGAELFHFLAYDPQFRGGVRVAVGDVLGDGDQEIVTVPGPGANPLVKVYSGSDGTLIGEFLATPATYRGGLSVAVGDVSGSGHDEIITASDRGAPRVSIYSGANGGLVASFLAYQPGYHDGVNVAIGDLDQSGDADIVTAPRSGLPEIKVFDGVSQALVTHFEAYHGSTEDGVSVTVGDVTTIGTLDIITAAPNATGTGAALKVFSGSSGQELAQISVPGREYAHGVRIAAVDVNGDHADELALASPTGKGVAVVDTSSLQVAALESSIKGPGTSLLGGVPNTPPPVAYRVSSGSVHGSFVAASSSVTESTPAALAESANPIGLSLTPIQRLAYYDPSSGQFVLVTPDDPRLVGKDVYVLVHGWAPGYNTWVQKDAALGQVLEWWQTFPGQPGYNAAISGGLPPASEWLLDGHTEDSIVVSSTGMVQDLLASDPNAAVLAYSWIDDSATPVSSYTGIPEDAYLSEAMTTLNGERLAVALEQVLGSEAQFHGKLQLIGHSHGSRVATVAAVALTDAANPITVNQLTILDSPESSNTDLGYLLAEQGASNNDWYFLQDLDIDRADPSATFVDNYVSYFDEPFDVISYPGSNSNLSQVVDVSLDAEPYSALDPAGQHSYAAYWYAGSSEPALTYGNTVGRQWSPLLPGNTGPTNPPQNLSSSYEQSWDYFDYSQSNQFDLNTYTPSPLNPVFNPLTLPAKSTPGVDVTNSAGGASVQLTQQNGTLQSYTGSFTTAGFLHGIRGITFTYQFQNAAPGDELTISIDGDLAFVMDASLMQSQAGPGTITVGDLFGDESHTLTFTLTSTQPNSTSSVIVSNLRQFADE
jgi:hypothetical protein